MHNQYVGLPNAFESYGYVQRENAWSLSVGWQYFQAKWKKAQFKKVVISGIRMIRLNEHLFQANSLDDKYTWILLDYAILCSSSVLQVYFLTSQ